MPPDKEIPGEHEIADGAITQWTIPNTRITVARIKNGPRAGEFLFSADTVQQLGRFYQQVQHLPYKPGASIGAYENSICSDAGSLLQIQARDRGVDTSNPRSTLEGFLYGVNRAYELAMQVEAALTATPPTMTLVE